ncbi:MAG: hypothetical protein J6W73_05600, partial [Verrucomicrobia bacterium]|nr:hypothetical protein [Verrucomicrobiota bacterium]
QFNRKQMHITPVYSNAVYQALLPRLAEAVQQLELKNLQPFTAEQIKWISIYKASPEVTTGFADESSLLMSPFGLFYLYYSPSSLFYESTFRKRFYREDTSVYTANVSAFIGQNRMSREEIIDMARQLKERLCKTGYSDVLFSIDGEPEIEGPFDVKDGQVPYVKVSWGENFGGSWENEIPIYWDGKSLHDQDKVAGNYFEVEINTDKKQIVSFWVKPTIENLAKHFSYQIPEGLHLELAEKPETETEYKQRIFGKRYPIIGQRIHVTETYSNAVLKIMLPRATDMAKKLKLPIELPITEDQVEGFKVSQYGYIGGRLFLKNGWQLCIDGEGPGKRYELDAFSPDFLFPLEWNWDNFADFYGTNKMTEAEIIEYSKDIAGRLGFGELLKDRDRPSEKIGPFETGGRIKKEIPRVSVCWRPMPGEPHYTIYTEFNTETKEIDRVRVSMNMELVKSYDVIMGNTENKDLYPETEEAYRARMQKEKEGINNSEKN